ncbi:ATP phosphoribosyltransferase regulatory subunit [Terrilactibacillus sp. BCM23-1]|uniref:ATP phosphoribosyltransferase regulatory subunit n=1 Tax=Terrilactibacillus tamarindi TaxID=2599694 RepID=A0A6N8CNH9_9BACI|nr:ATP phosphoribosyltransferase regulatory subunit [Terrilactibacillus tamarindi]MTT31642.1 ATP phosphoribosyltransferase regulatory subunit [Terrilactibacillus tamarindi]
MTKPYMFEKPLGLRDTLPQAHRISYELKDLFYKEMNQWGYDFIKTPALEFAETVGKASAIDDHQLFKFMDRQGIPVVLRPDMTTPIARVVGSELKEAVLPLRLAYTSALYRAQKSEGGHPSEFEQVGAELIGDATPEADAEVISLMVKLFEIVGLDPIRIVIGHVGFVDAFIRHMVFDEEHVLTLRELLYMKNDVGFRHVVAQLDIPPQNKRDLNQFIDTRSLDINKTLQFMEHHPCSDYYQEVNNFMRLLKAYGLLEKIDLDLTLVPHLDYYTGFVFEGYGGKIGFSLASGGRYNDLLKQFNRPAPATGFGIRLDRLIESLPMDAFPDEPEKMAVVYELDTIQEALEYANQKRKEGLRVVLQNAKSIQDERAFQEQFKTVKSFIKTGGLSI